MAIKRRMRNASFAALGLESWMPLFSSAQSQGLRLRAWGRPFVGCAQLPHNKVTRSLFLISTVAMNCGWSEGNWESLEVCTSLAAKSSDGLLSLETCW